MKLWLIGLGRFSGPSNLGHAFVYIAFLLFCSGLLMDKMS